MSASQGVAVPTSPRIWSAAGWAVDDSTGWGTFRRRSATALAVLSAVAVVLTVVLSVSQGERLRSAVDEHQAVGVVVALEFAGLGWLVVRQRSMNLLGWVFLSVSVSLSLSGFAAAYAARTPPPRLGQVAAVVGEVGWLPGALLGAGLLTVVFPEGRPVSPRWGPLVWIGTLPALGSLLILPFVAVPTDLPHAYGNPWAVERWQPGLELGVELLVATALGSGALGAALLIHRMLATQGAERARIGWFFAAFTATFVSAVLPLDPIVPTLVAPLAPVMLAVAVIRHGLFEGDQLLGRTLAYVVLTLLITGVFAFCVALASTVVGGSGTGVIVAAVVIALGVVPTRTRVQRVIDRLIYGGRRDPYAALTTLSQQLSVVPSAEHLLPRLVQTVCEAVRVPYAAVTIIGDPTPAAAYGLPDTEQVCLPLLHAGAEVGSLSVGLRPGQRGLEPTDRAVLADLARHAGPLVAGAQLHRELRLSHDRLLAAQEQERRRIRRDLHDGLGPTLAGIALGLGAAARQTSRSGSADATTLEELRQEVVDALGDVKRLVADLRPTALQDTDLLTAVRAYADVLGAAEEEEGCRIDVCGSGLTSAALSAVELTAYHIVREALSNVVQHAEARHCDVWMVAERGVLRVTVADDGRGSAAYDGTGLGIRSMAERAAEHGGSFSLSPRVGGGTQMCASLPLDGAP